MGFSIFLLCSGAASIVYFALYVLSNGINNSFLYFWLALGAALFAWSWLHRYFLKSGMAAARKAEHVVMGIVCVFLLVFAVLLGRLVSEGNAEPKKGADYVIILGAHVFGERMSANLRYRVEAAAAYLKENPQTKAVLSGGQGSGESITEAEAMYRYLTEQGIDESRLLRDDTSVNTEQNIQNSKEKIGSSKKRVIVVSNDFHIYRAVRLARRQGFTKVEGLGAKTYPYTVPNCYVREVFAVLKYRLCGQL